MTFRTNEDVSRLSRRYSASLGSRGPYVVRSTLRNAPCIPKVVGVSMQDSVEVKTEVLQTTQIK